MSTPNLGIIYIAASQNQKEVTANAAFLALEQALTDSVVETMSDSSFELPLDDAQENMVFLFTGSLSAARGVTLPSVSKLYIVSNQTYSDGSPISPGQALVFGTASSPTGRVSTVEATAYGSKYVILYCDGVNVDRVSPDDAYDIGIYNDGVGSNNAVYLNNVPPTACLFPAGAVRSTSRATVAATSSTVFNFKKNGSIFATLTYAAGASFGVWAQASNVTFNGVTDALEIDGPASADATLAGFGFFLAGIKV